MKRNKTDIKNAIQDQLLYIKNSCELFDKGCRAESIRIAVAISVLLEKRLRGAKGLLRLQDYEFKLLSTIPYVREVELHRLSTSKAQSINGIDKLIRNFKDNIENKNRFFLIYIEDIPNWFIYALDFQGNEIKCLINKLTVNLSDETKKVLRLSERSSLSLQLPRLINSYTEQGRIDDENGKRIIIEQLNWFLGYDNDYVSGLFFPMINGIYCNESSPILSDSKEKKSLNIDDWLKEIIFGVTDDHHKLHSLTRKKLIDSARDQDGGGHYDIKLKVMSYVKSKGGELLAELNGKDITTKDFHLVMLRQLGYEVLNSNIESHIKGRD